MPSSLRSEEHTSELQSLRHLVCRLLLEKKKKTQPTTKMSLTEIQGSRTYDDSAAHLCLRPVSDRTVLVWQPRWPAACSFFFFFNDTATTEIYTLSLHDALPICPVSAADAGSQATLSQFAAEY